MPHLVTPLAVSASKQGMCSLQVLLRALRDFNLGKLTSDDTGIFVGLLNDLFPRTLELVPRAIDQVFETQCRKSARELKFQPDDMFCLKISQVCSYSALVSVNAVHFVRIMPVVRLMMSTSFQYNLSYFACSFERFWLCAGLSSFWDLQDAVKLQFGRPCDMHSWSLVRRRCLNL